MSAALVKYVINILTETAMNISLLKGIVIEMIESYLCSLDIPQNLIGFDSGLDWFQIHKSSNLSNCIPLDCICKFYILLLVLKYDTCYPCLVLLRWFVKLELRLLMCSVKRLLGRAMFLHKKCSFQYILFSS